MSTEPVTTVAARLLEDLAHLTEAEKVVHLVQAVAELEERELSFRRLYDAEKKETARLQTAVEMRGTVIAQAQATLASLRAALKPFAEFVKAYGPVASALDYPEDHVLMAAPPAGSPTVVRLSDLYTALKALGEG